MVSFEYLFMISNSIEKAIFVLESNTTPLPLSFQYLIVNKHWIRQKNVTLAMVIPGLVVLMMVAV